MKISFDFNGTLSRKSVQKYAKQLIDKGIDCIITTFRQKEYLPIDSNDDYNCLREIQRNSKCIPISVCTGNWQGKIERIIRRKGIH